MSSTERKFPFEGILYVYSTLGRRFAILEKLERRHDNYLMCIQGMTPQHRLSYGD